MLTLRFVTTSLRRSGLLRQLAALLVCCFAGATLAAQVSLTMEVQQEKKGKMVDKGSSTMTMVSDGERGAIITAMEDGETRIIYDAQNKNVTTISPSDGKLVAMRMPLIGMKGKTPAAADFEGTFEATGETKEILGYRTEKFLVTKDGEVMECWVADIPGFDYGLIAEGLGQKAGAQPEVPGVDSPVVLEAHSPSKGGKEVTHMYIRAVASGSDVDLAMLEVPAGVELTDMSALMKF